MPRAAENLLKKVFIYLLIAALLAPGYSLASDPSQKNVKIKIAVIDLVPLKDVEPEESKLLTDIIRDVVFKTGRYSMLTKQDMQTILERASLQQQLGLECDTDKCISKIAEALGVEQMIAGNIGKIGETFLISLRLVDSFQGQTINTQIKKIKGTDEELMSAVEEITGRLFNPVKKTKAENDALVIDHAPVETTTGKDNITVSAFVKGSKPVSEITLNYRKTGDDFFSITSMKETGNRRYEGIIPADQVSKTGLEYFIEAKDTNGNSFKNGGMSMPHQISVKNSKTKIKWWKWALGVVAVGATGAILAGLGGGGGENTPNPSETKTGSTTVIWIE